MYGSLYFFLFRDLLSIDNFVLVQIREKKKNFHLLLDEDTVFFPHVVSRIWTKQGIFISETSLDQGGLNKNFLAWTEYGKKKTKKNRALETFLTKVFSKELVQFQQIQ